MKKILSLILILGAAVCANAQFDYFAQPRYLQAAYGSIGQGAASNSAVTVDLHAIEGVAALVFNWSPDNALGVATVTVQNSSDNTNWTTFANVAYLTNAAVTATNYSFASGIANTTTNLLAGTITTPVAGTAGFATQYINPFSFTATGLFTNTGAGNTVMGFNANDAKRYMRVVIVPSGTGTNFGYGGVVIGRARSTP